MSAEVGEDRWNSRLLDQDYGNDDNRARKVIDLSGMRYSDPTAPRPDYHTVMRCARCGNVPKHRKLLIIEPRTGRLVCKSEKACRKRGTDPLAKEA